MDLLKDKEKLQGLMSQDLSEQRQLGPNLLHNVLAILCYCGLSRLLPGNLAVGDRISLPPCPRCGAFYTGLYSGDSVHLD